MEIRPLSPQVGAEVIGVDISQPLPNDVFKTIDDAYNHYSVLVFRGQKLTPEQQIAFSRPPLEPPIAASPPCPHRAWRR